MNNDMQHFNSNDEEASIQNITEVPSLTDLIGQSAEIEGNQIDPEYPDIEMSVSDESEPEPNNGIIFSDSADCSSQGGNSEDLEETNTFTRMTNEIVRQRNEPEKAVLNFIQRMEYPAVYIGKISRRQMTHVDWRIIKRGKMTSEEKALFDYANTILQYPSSLTRALMIKKTSRNKYAYAISRYLQFSAKNKITPAQLTVEGVFMAECMRKHIEERTLQGHAGDSTKTIEGFQHGLGFFNHCFALYKCRDIKDTVEKANKVSELKIIPNLQYLIEYAKERKSLHHEIARDNFHNKHRDEYTNETYTIANLKAMMINMYNLTGQGDGKKKEIYYGINSVLEILMGHHLLYRGDNKRSAEISDITFRDYDSARGSVKILGFTTNQSKTINGGGKPHSMGACRNKDVEICLVTAIAMSFWYRFDFETEHGNLTGENRPDFLDKRSWYPVKVLFADSSNSRNNEKISYKHEALLVKLCLQSIGVVMTKTTHLGRQVGARRADANLIEISQIKRAGNWRQSILEGRYLTSYPLEFIFFSGGFASDEPYDCPRDIEPPESLQAKIFPWLDAVIKQVDARDNATSWVGNNTKDVDKDTAAAKFLQMLKTFRKVILQDLTNLVDRAPQSIFSKHPITRDPEFIRFKEKVLKSQQELGLSESMQEMKTVANILAPSFGKKSGVVLHALNRIYTAIVRGFDESQRKLEETVLSTWKKRDDDIVQEIKKAVGDQLWEVINDRYQNDDARDYCARSKSESIMKLITSLREENAQFKEENTQFKKALEAISERVDLILYNQKTHIEATNETNHMSSVVCDRIAGPNAKFIDPLVQKAMFFTPEGPPPGMSEGHTSFGQLNEPDNDSGEAEVQPLGPGLTALSSAVPSLRMGTESDTVMKLLDEWYVSKPGKPSVEQRDRIYGKTWRGAFSIYKRRKAIINFMEHHLKERSVFVTRSQLGQLIDDYRARNCLQMNGLCAKFQNSHSKEEITQELGQIWAQVKANQ